MVQPLVPQQQGDRKNLQLQGEISGGSLFQAVAALALKDAGLEGKLRKAVGQVVLDNTQVSTWGLRNASTSIADGVACIVHCTRIVSSRAHGILDI
jgi:hypothetical protein